MNIADKLALYSLLLSLISSIIGYFCIVRSWRYVDIIYYYLGVSGIVLLFFSQASEIERINLARELFQIDNEISSARNDLEISQKYADVLIRREEFGDDLGISNSSLRVAEWKMLSWSEREQVARIIENLPDPRLEFQKCLELFFDEGCYIIHFHLDEISKKFDMRFSTEEGWSYRDPVNIDEVCLFQSILQDIPEDLDHCSGTPAWGICPIRLQLWALKRRCSPEELKINPQLSRIISVDEVYSNYLIYFNNQLIAGKNEKIKIEEDLMEKVSRRNKMEYRFRSINGWNEIGFGIEYFILIIRYYLWPFVLVTAVCLKIGKAANDLGKSRVRKGKAASAPLPPP